MIHHTNLGSIPFERSRKLRALLAAGKILLGGNKKLKIYGLLTCWSGRRMKPKNRVFFQSEKEAIALGFRPCLHCMKSQYAGTALLVGKK